MQPPKSKDKLMNDLIPLSMENWNDCQICQDNRNNNGEKADKIQDNPEPSSSYCVTTVHLLSHEVTNTKMMTVLVKTISTQ
jgi:hypothetical protein